MFKLDSTHEYTAEQTLKYPSQCPKLKAISFENSQHGTAPQPDDNPLMGRYCPHSPKAIPTVYLGFFLHEYTN